MEMNSFRQELIEEYKINSINFGERESDQFLLDYVERLTDSEIIATYELTYFNNVGRRNKIMKIEGYSKEESDRSYTLFICDYVGGQEIISLTNTDITKLANQVIAFIESSLDGYICDNFEISAPAYQLAKDLKEETERNQVNRINIVILTDKKISDRVKALELQKLGQIEIILDIYDIDRIYSMALSNSEKEEIEIVFSDETALPGILAIDDEEMGYQSYLAVINGDILADLYLRYGARLLEGNVRSFLSNRTGVNKEIRKTIKNEPSMFFAYNNGIAATAANIETKILNGMLKITKIKNFQIINGGQTTASLANAKVQDKVLVNLEKVYVPVKLSIIEDEKKLEEIIPIISKSSNSQNKIDAADFFSNHEFHIRMETYSRKIYAPAKKGEFRQTQWFYERARGQHVQEQVKLTASEKKKFLEKCPKKQIIKKVELSKYLLIYYRKPDIVSKGAQAGMREFTNTIEKRWEKHSAEYNELFFKKVVALAVVFKATEKLVSDSNWYKEIKAYRANIVAYSLAIILQKVEETNKGVELDFQRIWNEQNIYPEFENQLQITTLEVLNFITREDRGTLNVTEWCKKPLCWEQAKLEKWTIDEYFIESLTSNESVEYLEKDAIRERKLDNDLDVEVAVVNVSGEDWTNILKFGEKMSLLTVMEKDLLKVASRIESTRKMPTLRQCKKIIEIKEKLIKEGMNKLTYD